MGSEKRKKTKRGCAESDEKGGGGCAEGDEKGGENENEEKKLNHCQKTESS